MAIGKRPKIADDDVAFQQFVERAPGAAVPKEPESPKEARQPEQPKKKVRIGKRPITITIDPALLRKVDAAAAGKGGMSRAAYIAMALSYAVDHGIFK
jgi:hypothetical protein